MDKLQLNVVTPINSFFSGTIDSVIVRTTEGDISFMKNHLPFVAGLNIGLLRITVDGNERKAITTSGFVKFTDNEISILTDYCEWIEDIKKNDISNKLESLKKVDVKDMKDVDKEIHNKNISTYERILKLLP